MKTIIRKAIEINHRPNFNVGDTVYEKTFSLYNRIFG